MGVVFYLFSAFADHDDPAAEPLPVSLHVEDIAKRAFDIVENQVREATTQSEAGWASQPGAIRTFREDGSTARIYKLYSAPDLLAGSTSEALADLPADWDQYPTRFVDLNTPELVEGLVEFPIADPNSDAEGFAISDTINGVSASSLPMPVQWMYFLQDGTRGYLDGENRFIGERVPTSDNSIIGRAAFWADDNTCKINVNTASEGVHWDIPRTDSLEDRGLSRSQPVAGEYQRHPGHPATACLSSVLFPGKRIGTPEGGHGALEELPLAEAGLLWKIGNGTGPGGSQAGTVTLEQAQAQVLQPMPFHYTPYGNLDEMLERAGNAEPELVERVARGKFFLTTESNAPELTVSGYPRVSTWPTERDSRATVLGKEFDRMAASRYRFGRTSARSRHVEFYSNSYGENERLFSYLRSQISDGTAEFGLRRPCAGY